MNEYFIFLKLDSEPSLKDVPSLCLWLVSS